MGLGEAVGAGDQHQGPLPEILLLVVLGQAGLQIAGLADVDPPVVIACVFPHQHIDADLAALLHGQEVGQGLRGTSITWTMRVVISAMRMPWGSPLGRKIWIVLGVWLMRRWQRAPAPAHRSGR